MTNVKVAHAFKRGKAEDFVSVAFFLLQANIWMETMLDALDTRRRENENKWTCEVIDKARFSMCVREMNDFL